MTKCYLLMTQEIVSVNQNPFCFLICIFVMQEICLCDSPVVMALVDGPTGENDHMICVAYKHQFDLINESTGDAYRLHHVDSNRVRNKHQRKHSRHVNRYTLMASFLWLVCLQVNFVAAIDVYEDGEAGLLLCYNSQCLLGHIFTVWMLSCPV